MTKNEMGISLKDKFSAIVRGFSKSPLTWSVMGLTFGAGLFALLYHFFGKAPYFGSSEKYIMALLSIYVLIPVAFVNSLLLFVDNRSVNRCFVLFSAITVGALFWLFSMYFNDFADGLFDPPEYSVTFFFFFYLNGYFLWMLMGGLWFLIRLLLGLNNGPSVVSFYKRKSFRRIFLSDLKYRDFIKVAFIFFVFQMFLMVLLIINAFADNRYLVLFWTLFSAMNFSTGFMYFIHVWKWRETLFKLSFVFIVVSPYYQDRGFYEVEAADPLFLGPHIFLFLQLVVWGRYLYRTRNSLQSAQLQEG